MKQICRKLGNQKKEDNFTAKHLSVEVKLDSRTFVLKTKIEEKNVKHSD